jgi:L-lactate dehydrogenase complex protein LldE
VKIALFVPCYVDQFYPRVAESVVRILERLGHQIVFDESLVCCGQPAFNAGSWDDARSVAGRVLSRLQAAEAVVVPSGSCATMIRAFYPEIFKHSDREKAALALAERTYEFSQFIVDRLGVADLQSQFPAKATFHDGCHGLRELGVRSQPRLLLSYVRDLELIEMEDNEVCCGFGGLFAVKFPMISTAMGETKCDLAKQTGAQYLISNDSSCLMHLEGLLKRSGSEMKTLHLAEVLSRWP